MNNITRGTTVCIFTNAKLFEINTFIFGVAIYKIYIFNNKYLISKIILKLNEYTETIYLLIIAKTCKITSKYIRN